MNASTQTLPANAVVEPAIATARAATLPWYCYALVLGAACIPIGAIWDIS